MIQAGDSNTFTLDTTDTGSGGDTGSGDSNTFTLDTTDTGTGGDTGWGDSNTFTLDTTDTGTGDDTGSGDSNTFTLDTTDSGTGGDTGSGDSNTFTLDTTDTGTGGDTGSGDSNTFTLDTTEQNNPPQFISDNYFSISENQLFIAQILATDEDGDGLIFEISEDKDGSLVEVNATSGELSFILAPDYENPQDENLDNTYQILVSVSDNEVFTTLEINIVVNDLDDSTPILSLLGDTNITHEAGTEYFDLGANWHDNIDGNGTADSNGTVNPFTLGTYKITYSFTDSSGNTAQSVVRGNSG